MIDKHLQALAEDVSTATTPAEHLQIARDWAVMLGSVGLAAALVASLLSAAYVALAPLWVLAPLVVAACVLGVIALGVWRTLGFARYAIQSRLYQFESNQETLREIAKIAATTQTTVSVKGRQNVVSVNSTGQAVESVRLVPLTTAQPVRVIDGVQEQDLAYFIQRMMIAGWTARAWFGQTLPSGKQISTFDDYNLLMNPLLKAGVIVDRGNRSAGHLTTDDPSAILGRLGITPGSAKDVTPGE